MYSFAVDFILLFRLYISEMLIDSLDLAERVDQLSILEVYADRSGASSTGSYEFSESKVIFVL